MRKYWWKILGVLLIIYSFTMGLLVPLKPGIAYFQPGSLKADTTQTMEITGYNTFYTKAAEPVRVWLKWDDDHAINAWNLIRKDFEDIAAQRGCPIKIEETWRVEHSPFDEKRVQLIMDSAETLGYPYLHMVSGAGHDASYMNQVCPTAMIFVPSIGGRSHVEVENTKWEDCEAGANVLLHAILKSANEK